MKWYIKILLALGILFLPNIGFAATVNYFEVTLSKDTANVGEALDISITAVDKNGETIKDYVGEILVFSESDPEAEFPNELKENSYKFTTANEGLIKFENAVVFKNEGKQDVYVYDLNDDSIYGMAEVTVAKDTAPETTDISIVSPENGVTLGKTNVMVSWTTQKNHQVKIILNGSQEFALTSNGEWAFEKDVTGLKQWENTLQAQVLDAENKKIGESEIIKIKINASAPEFKSIKITPAWIVDAQSALDIQVVSNTGLRDVKVIIDDVITTLKEVKDGIYEGKTTAPKDAWKYAVDVVLKDDFWLETQSKAAYTLEVKAVEMNAAWDPVIELIEENPLLEELNLAITDIQVTELKTKSIITWKALADAESYNVYKKIDATKVELVGNVKEPRFEIEITGDEIKYDEFAIKALGKTASGEVVTGNLSDMTKVQTGPELYILLALLAFWISGFMFYFQKRRTSY